MIIVMSIIIFVLIFYGIAMTFLANYAWTFNRKKYQLLEKENDLMIYWLQKKIDGVDIKEYFEKRKIKSVAFYKFTPLCEMLCAELEEYVSIRYCIDENADNIWDGIENVPIISPDDINKYENADLLIIATTEEETFLEKTAEQFVPDGQIAWGYEIIKEF